MVDNMIGTDLTGTQAIPNGVGVLLISGTFGNTIGGSARIGKCDLRQPQLQRRHHGRLP